MLGAVLLLFALRQFHYKKFKECLFLFFLFVTNGFQLIPSSLLMAGLPLDKPSDLALIFILVVALKKGVVFKQIGKQIPESKWCFFLVFFLVLEIFYSYLEMGYTFVNIIQVFRPYLMLLSFVVFINVDLPILQKVFHRLAIVTIIQSALFLMQIFLNTPILLAANGTDNVGINTLTNGYARFYNTPSFLLPTLFYFLFVYKFRHKVVSFLVNGLLFLTVLGPMHRSLMLTVIASILIFILIRQRSRYRIVYLAGLSMVMVVVSFVGVINRRISEAFTDLVSTAQSNLRLQNINVDDNTMLFRIGHFLERFEYIMSLNLGWLFGIGLISDNSPIADNLPFRNGLVSEKTQQVVQIDTGDLIWSPLFLTLGIVGTFIYTVIFIKLLKYFYSKVPETPYAIVGFLTVLMGFFTSFAGTEMLSITFRTMTILLLVLVYKACFESNKNSYQLPRKSFK
jgi:hypothetical protein